jgi:hypothetical protein
MSSLTGALPTAALSLHERLAAAKTASRDLAIADTDRKNRALRAIADGVLASSADILSANELDLANGRENGLSTGLLDRLTLSPARLQGLADAVLEIVGLTDPVGEAVRGSSLPNGVKITQVRVPFGVVGAIYEARPNVTIDIAALALKSGNASVLRGASRHRRHRGVGSNQVPVGWPVSAAATFEVEASSTAVPPAAASFAEAILVPAPPVPTPAEPMSPISTPARSSSAATKPMGSAPGSWGGFV